MMQTLIDNGHDAYIIGGAVRDSVLGLKPKDWDIFTNASGQIILELFPDGKILGGKERQAKILTVIVRGVEISQYRSNPERTETGNSLNMHLGTCDFTINAMMLDNEGTLIDPHNGFDDINDGHLRCVGKASNRMNEDKLRILRAIRFMVKYGFEPDAELSKELHNADLSTLPIERVTEEFMKIISIDGGMAVLSSYGLLEKIIPEVSNLYQLDGGIHHNETVFEHCLMAHDISCTLTNNTLLRFACFMHDIGKGTSHQEDERGIHFKMHEIEGKHKVEEIMKRMKFSNNDIKYVSCLVENHMFGLRASHKSNAYRKLFAQLEERKIPVEDFVLVSYCDSQANMNNHRAKYHEKMKKSSILRKYYEMKFSKDPFSVRDLAINGHDVMSFGITEGKEVGRILDAVFQKVCNGELPNERIYLMRALKDGLG